MEKFSIDIETFYKADAGENPDVFSLSPVEKNQLTTGEQEAQALGAEAQTEAVPHGPPQQPELPGGKQDPLV